MARILLLGKNGQLGWELQRALAPLGELIACDRLACDLNYSNSLHKTLVDIAPDIVINAAAYTAVDRAEQNSADAFQINAAAVAFLAEYAASQHILLIHYSSDYVFDGLKSDPYNESDGTNPLSIYGASKRSGEEAVINSGCNYLIFRTSWVFATRGANFAKTMLRLALEKDTLRVVADQWGAPTSAELIADITAHALRAVIAKKAPGGLYHVAAGGETTWHGYASYIVEQARLLGAPIKTSNIEAIATAAYPLPAARPANSRLDTGKLRDTFNLTLPNWQFHVERMLVELLENPNALQ
jgi:dTDP-4-dehydrorhamnose reductase